jgi:hypothetical protein
MDNKYYIIRTGDFAVNGNKKMIYSMLSVLLCIDDYYTNQSYDCFSIMIGSSFVWAIVELLLHVSNTRIIHLRTFKFAQKYELNYSKFRSSHTLCIFCL